MIIKTFLLNRSTKKGKLGYIQTKKKKLFDTEQLLLYG